MNYKTLKKEISSLNILLEDDAVTVLASKEVEKPELPATPDEVQIVPPKEEHQVPAVYSTMEQIEPKNSRVKAAYADKAAQGSTKFIFVVEELDRGDDEFHGRAAIVCKHAGKLVYAAVSYPQRAKSAIPPNLYKMIPVRGATMPAWVKAYVDSSVHTMPEEQ